MGGKNEKGENMDWSPQMTIAFIEIIYDRVKKSQLQGSTFKAAIWEDINNELTRISGENYGIVRLKGKFNRLRILHREFSTLLAQTGVSWDLESNKVNAPEDVWQDLYTKGRFYKKFKKHGFEHNYDILGKIFNSSTATGKLSPAFIRESPTSGKAREIEEDFLSEGVHIDSHAINVDKGSLEEVGKKQKAIGSSSERRCKEAKNSRLENLGAAFGQWTETMSARTKASKAKTKASIANQATSAMSDPYSIDACMELLDSMDDIPSKIYNNALVKFKDKDWRHMFIRMPSFRRMDWLSSLE